MLFPLPAKVVPEAPLVLNSVSAEITILLSILIVESDVVVPSPAPKELPF